MAIKNIEIQRYNGSSYDILYPKIDLNNNIGTSLSSTYIPNLSASKITSGTFTTARIPSLDASKITSGVFDINRLPTSVKSSLETGSYTGTGTTGITPTSTIGTYNGTSRSYSFTSPKQIFLIFSNTMIFAELISGNSGYTGLNSRPINNFLFAVKGTYTIGFSNNILNGGVYKYSTENLLITFTDYKITLQPQLVVSSSNYTFTYSPQFIQNANNITYYWVAF